MRADEIRLLLDYNHWANERLLETAARAGADLFLAPGHLSHGGLRATLVHTLSAEWIWRRRYAEEVSPRKGLAEADFPTLQSLRARWEEEGRAVRAFADTLTDADLQRVVHYENMQGTPFARRLWQILLHVVNHGTQTRSEAAVLLTDAGYSPGEFDLMMYINETYPPEQG